MARWHIDAMTKREELTTVVTDYVLGTAHQTNGFYVLLGAPSRTSSDTVC